MGDETRAVTGVAAQPLTIVAGSGGREVRLRGHRTARVVAGVLAVLLAAGVARWAVVVWRGLDPCHRQSPLACTEAGGVARWGQFVFAVPGIVVGVVLVAYGVRFATTATTWRRRTLLYVAFLASAALWTAVYTVGALTVR